MVHFPHQHFIVIKKHFDPDYPPRQFHFLLQSVNLIIIPISPHQFLHLYNLSFAIFALFLSTKLLAIFSIWKN